MDGPLNVLQRVSDGLEQQIKRPASRNGQLTAVSDTLISTNEMALGRLINKMNALLYADEWIARLCCPVCLFSREL